MAAAVVGSTSHTSLWDSIKDQKYDKSASGSGWGTGGGWDENGGWGSASSGSGSKGWGSGSGKAGEWGSSESEGGWGWGGGWGSSTSGAGWGSTSGGWTNSDSSGGGSGSTKQPTLTDFWSEKSAAPQRDEPREVSSSSSTSPHVHPAPDRNLESGGSNGWASATGGWGTAGAGSSIWEEANTTDRGAGKTKAKDNAATEATTTDVPSPLFSPVLYPKLPDLSASGAPDAHIQSSSQPGASSLTSYSNSEPYTVPHAAAYPQPHFITHADGSSEYHPYPSTYDLRATWAANYTGYYIPLDLPADAAPNSLEDAMDRHLERYYWDLRYQSEIPHPSPYIQEMHNLPEKQREIILARLAQIDFMFSRVERKLHPLASSVSASSSHSPPSIRDFRNQHDRDVKQTVYKALRLLYREWHDGAEYPSVLDWEGDHSMLYRVGAMIG